jgi:hypothetical protein
MGRRLQGFVFSGFAVLILTASGNASGWAATLRQEASGSITRLVFVADTGKESELWTTIGRVAGERAVDVAAAGVVFAAWDETFGDRTDHRVTISLDRGASWSPPRVMNYAIPLRVGRLIPGVGVPDIPDPFRAGADDPLYIVQFETTGLEAWRRMLRDAGADVLSYLPEHAHVVRADALALSRVAALPFVRWVGRYEPGFKIEPEVMRETVDAGFGGGVPRRYHLQTFAPGPAEKALLAAEVRAAGGSVVLETPNGYLLDAVLDFGQVVRIAHSEHLLWLDRWSAPEQDMDIVREQSGANYVESVAGYSGQGVRGEVMDAGIEQTHADFDGIQIHGPAAGVDSHGTSTYGIVFGNGARDGDGDAKGTGHLPSREAGWFYDYDNLGDRYQETAELVRAPIFAVFQSNSWGDARTRSYNSISAQMDDIIWLNDIAIFQSQSNAGNQDSRPQAWAKNIISIGAVNHYDTLALSDDCWCSGASIGPAEDGRIKPDLAYWYDSIYTTTTGNSYTSGFGGTSAATPITAGIGGLFFQMWADNVLGNSPQGTTVFEKRPHAATLKALMINTAEQYPFAGTVHDLTRMHQGWGLPSARRFYDRRSLLEVVDQTEPLQELDVHTWTAIVPSGQSELKVTLVYTDRAGTTSSTLHRINDVSVKVTSPDGSTTWYGNNGLEAGNWSAPGGGPDTKNTVENVFIQSPAAGPWTIEISADDLNQDEHAATPEIDQDYALVVYGADSFTLGCAVPPPPPSGLTATPSGDNRVDLAWTGTPTARGYRVYRSAGGCGGTLVQVAGLPPSATSWTDTNASGGMTYGYVVRSVEGCESPSSNCSEATATGPCILPPSFAGVATAAGNDTASCGITIGWPAASPNCGGPIAYNVYRGTTAAFTPSANNRVGSCLQGTTFLDARGLTSNVTYYYIVRAEDLAGRGSTICGGATDSNSVAKSALARGTLAVILDDGFETGFEGWTPSKGNPPAAKGDFAAGTPNATTSGGQPAQPGACAAGSQCLFTQLNKGNADNGDVDDGEVLVTSPAFDASSFATARLTLSRWHFNNAPAPESGDYFTIDVSSDGGSSWVSLETLSGTVNANEWTPVAFDLQSYRPLTAQMKIRVRSADGIGSDATVESAVDQVHVEGAQLCATVSPGTPGGTPAGSLRVDRDGSRLRLRWDADCGYGMNYSLYRGDLLAGYGSAAPIPGLCAVGTTTAVVDPGEGSYFFLVAPNDGSVEGSLGRASDGTFRAQPPQACFPRANPVDVCAP